MVILLPMLQSSHQLSKNLNLIYSKIYSKLFSAGLKTAAYIAVSNTVYLCMIYK